MAATFPRSVSRNDGDRSRRPRLSHLLARLRRIRPSPAPDARVRLLGFVADVRPLYVETNLLLVPTLCSAGTNVKALEAMAMQRAMVTTPSGCAGLNLLHGQSVWETGRAGSIRRWNRNLDLGSWPPRADRPHSVRSRAPQLRLASNREAADRPTVLFSARHGSSARGRVERVVEAEQLRPCRVDEAEIIRACPLDEYMAATLELK